MFKQFGGRFNQAEKQKLSKSKNWKKGKFENLEPTTIDVNLSTLPSLLKRQFTDTSRRQPLKNIPIKAFDLKAFENEEDKFVWFAHSVLLFKLANKTILFDPMFGPDASPIGPVRTKRFSANSIDLIKQLPTIDAVLMSHDHYDHLDLASYALLKDKVKFYYVPLGVARHLIAWGIPSQQIIELDWWDDFCLGEVFIAFTPSRHFTGRGLTDRAKCLWGGYVLKSPNQSIVISGDGGYGKHFKTIGEKYGPFDLCFIECGQYNKEWHQIHLYPEESVQAALDLQAKIAIPIHWAGFKLSLHDWKEPIERFEIEAAKKNLTISTPEIGELVWFKQPNRSMKWWEKFD